MLPHRVFITAGMISAFLLFSQIPPKGTVLGATTLPFPITPTSTHTVIPSPTKSPTPTYTPTPSNTPIFTPTPIPTATAMPTSAYEEHFDKYSVQYGVDKNIMKKIAYCESGMGPGAQNGPYGGMYQFTEDTWRHTRSAMGADTNPALRFGVSESIETAAFKISLEGTTAWKGCL